MRNTKSLLFFVIKQFHIKKIDATYAQQNKFIEQWKKEIKYLDKKNDKLWRNIYLNNF